MAVPARRPPRSSPALLALAVAAAALLLLDPAAAFLSPPPPLAAPSHHHHQQQQPSRIFKPLHAAGSSAPQDGGHLIYGGFWARGLAMLEAAFPAGALQPIGDIPADLAAAECSMPVGPKGGCGEPRASKTTRAEVHAYRVPGRVRLARAAVLTTVPQAEAPQVLNFVIFPDPTLDVPIFGADFVKLPGGHLIVLDFQPAAQPPAGKVGHPALDARLAALHARYGAVLPPGGAIPEAAQPFFSPYYLFTRAEEDGPVETTVYAAYQEYLALYLDVLQAATPVSDPGRLAAIREGQVRYATYRAENDPARGMLTRMFGAAWTERLIYDVLFDWAARKEEK